MYRYLYLDLLYNFYAIKFLLYKKYGMLLDGSSVYGIERGVKKSSEMNDKV